MNRDESKKAAIINSRQALRPDGDDLWIARSREAVTDAVGRNHTIVASVGMNAWEIPLYFASRAGARLELVVPVIRDDEVDDVRNYYCRQFQLKPAQVHFHFLTVPRGNTQKSTFQKERDLAVIKMADIVYPVSIRPGGNLEKLIEERRWSGGTIVPDFQAKYDRRSSECKVIIDLARLNPHLNRLLENNLIHWTRGTSAPWPDETSYQFYEDIIQTRNRYPRSALDTLRKILCQRKIIASCRHLRRGLRAVSFTGAPPLKAIELMRWRARYQEMSFEPYGIAVEKKAALDIGIRRVLYGDVAMFRNLESADRDYFQNAGKEGYWLPEEEYRYIGDFDLARLPEEKVTAVVWKKADIPEIGEKFKGRIIALEDD
ncbi:MAG: hypothetical protein HRF51_13610 [bacterium]